MSILGHQTIKLFGLTNMNLMPFDPEKNEPKDVGFGELSTEITVPLGDEDSGYLVVPMLWWDSEGNPILLGEIANEEAMPDENKILAETKKYEAETGKQFPRFSSLEKADAFTRERTKKGAMFSPLAKDIKEEKAKVANTFKEAI